MCCSWTCRTSAAASTRSSPRFATCSKKRRRRARPCGFWIARIPRAGPIEGMRLRAGWESFVGAGPLPDASRPHARRARALVRAHAEARRGLSGHPDGRLAAGGGARLRLAAGRAHLGEPEPERRESVDGARVRRHGDDRRHHAVRRPRHDAPAGAVRRAGHRCRGAAEGNAIPGAALAGGLQLAPLLVRAHVPQARRQALLGPADSRGGSGLRSRRVPAVACRLARAEGAAPPARRTTASGVTSTTSTSGTSSPSM